MNQIVIKLTCATNPEYHGDEATPEQAQRIARNILDVAEAFFLREFDDVIVQTLLVPETTSFENSTTAYEKVGKNDHITRDDIIDDYFLLRDRIYADPELLEDDFNAQRYLETNFPA